MFIKKESCIIFTAKAFTSPEQKQRMSKDSIHERNVANSYQTLQELEEEYEQNLMWINMSYGAPQEGIYKGKVADPK